MIAVLLVSWSGCVLAFPSIRGGSGLITIPTAAVERSTSVFSSKGKLVPSYTQSMGFAELGIQNQDGTNFYSAKICPIPEVSSEELWVPAMAAGVRGVSGSNEKREYYFVLSKKFTFPQSTVSFGMCRASGWSHGTNSLFYGIDLPLLDSVSLLADHDRRDGLTNVGVRAVFKKSFCIYDYVLDVLRKGPESGRRQNIIGVCYQNHF